MPDVFKDAPVARGADVLTPTLGFSIRGFLSALSEEFINVHSSGFMGSVLISDMPRRRKSLFVLGLALFYTLFVGGFALAFVAWWPVWAFWVMTGNRLLGLLIGQAPMGKEREFVRYTWAAAVFFYVLFAFATTVLPVPPFGITEEVVRRLNIPGGGLWIEEPHRVVAFGFFYFFAVGFSEMYGHAWFARVRSTETRRRE